MNKLYLNNVCPIFSDILSQIDFDGYSFVFIHHLTISNEPFLKEWINKTKTLGIISIPYSEVGQVKKRLSKITKVYSPTTLNEIPKYISRCVNNFKKDKIILVEVGGYSSSIKENLTNVVLTIEDTYQGHWLQKRNKNLSHPVVSIADTNAKKIENRYVGESIVRTAERILARKKIILRDNKQVISVISYGGIGSSVCLALRDRGIRPYVFDIDASKLAHAYADGYKIAEKKNILQGSDVIFGCTGQNSIKEADLEDLKNGAYLISGSSKQIEFQDLIKYFPSRKPDNLIQKITLKTKHAWVVYSGQPVNFLDKTDPRMFDVPFALQLRCFSYWCNHNLANKLYSLPERYQKEVLEKYTKYNFSIIKTPAI